MIPLRYPLILASKSPRRQHLLREAGFEFTIQLIPVDEQYPEGLQIGEVPEFLARKKAEPFISQSSSHIILTADTIVALDDLILGKPETESQARQMLSSLSGRSHKVYTGVCFVCNQSFTSFVEATEVVFKKLDKKEIDYYIKHYAPMDKAGAYGIQEWIGLIGIEKIKGSYSNVVGLPVSRLYQSLHEAGLLLQ